MRGLVVANPTTSAAVTGVNTNRQTLRVMLVVLMVYFCPLEVVTLSGWAEYKRNVRKSTLSQGVHLRHEDLVFRRLDRGRNSREEGEVSGVDRLGFWPPLETRALQ